MPANASDSVMCLCVPQDDYERLQSRAADCGMSTSDYTGMALDFCDCLPIQMLVAWRSGVLNVDMLEG